MNAITKKELGDEDWKTQLARGYPNIPKGAEVETIDEVNNLYGRYYVVKYNGNRYSVRPCDLKIGELANNEM